MKKDKKKKKSKFTNLIDMDVSAIALVDKGANNKTFHLFKRKEKNTMNKELAIKLLKASELTEDERNEILDQLEDDDRKAVEKAIDADIEKRGARLNKDIMSKLDQVIKILSAIKGIPAEDEKKEDKKVEKKNDDDDPEMTDEEFAALVKEEIGYEIEGKARPQTAPEKILADALRNIVTAKN